jgi:hypothetical protein
MLSQLKAAPKYQLKYVFLESNSQTRFCVIKYILAMPLSDQEIGIYRRDGLVIQSNYRMPGTVLGRINASKKWWLLPDLNRGPHH